MTASLSALTRWSRAVTDWFVLSVPLHSRVYTVRATSFENQFSFIRIALVVQRPLIISRVPAAGVPIDVQYVAVKGRFSFGIADPCFTRSTIGFDFPGGEIAGGLGGAGLSSYPRPT